MAQVLLQRNCTFVRGWQIKGLCVTYKEGKNTCATHEKQLKDICEMWNYL